jgi:hypothetical protein
LLVFFAPYVIRTLVWVGVNRAEAAALLVAINSVQWASERMGQSTDSNAREWARKAKDFSVKHQSWQSTDGLRFPRRITEVAQLLESLQRLLNEATELAISKDFAAQAWSQQAQHLLHVLRPSMHTKLREWSVWELLLGLDQGLGFFAIAAILVIYNIGRIILTYFVGGLREQEERSGDSPARAEYHRLYRVHQIVSVLILLAVGSFAIHAWHWLTLPVLLAA